MKKGNVTINKKLYKDADGSLARLNRQLRLLEIEHEKKLHRLKTSYTESSHDFLDFCSKLNGMRNKDELKLSKEIEDIEKSVIDISSVFKDSSQLEKADEKQLCNKVVRTSRNIFTMKDYLQIELKQLQSEENKTVQSLNAKYKDIDDFAKQHGCNKNNILLKHKLKAAIKANKNSSHQCREVINFQKFLDDSGGHYGGWKEEDHLLFLKVSGKHKPHKTAEIIHQQLPDKKLEDVLDHEEWYNKYMNLREGKKKAIEEWKEKLKQENCNLQFKFEDKPKVSVFKRDPKEKLRIEQWKTEQQLKKDKEMEEIKVKQMLKEKEEEEKKKILEHQREVINKYKQEKNNCEMAQAGARKEQEMQEAQQKAVEANKLLKQFRLEDRKYTERVKARRTSLKSDEEVPVKRSITAERDPDRLLQPTQVWIQRTKKVNHENENQAEPSHAMYILKVPHLRKPEWRKGLPL